MRKCGFGGVDGKVRVDVEGGVGGIGRGAAAVLAAWRWKRRAVGRGRLLQEAGKDVAGGMLQGKGNK